MPWLPLFLMFIVFKLYVQFVYNSLNNLYFYIHCILYYIQVMNIIYIRPVRHNIKYTLPAKHKSENCKLKLRYDAYTMHVRLRSHRNIRYTIYGIRYTLFGIRHRLYRHGGSHRSSTCFQYALFVSKKKVANSVF